MLCDSKSKFVELTLIIHYQLLIRSVLCFGAINEKHPQPDFAIRLQVQSYDVFLN